MYKDFTLVDGHVDGIVTYPTNKALIVDENMVKWTVNFDDRMLDVFFNNLDALFRVYGHTDTDHLNNKYEIFADSIEVLN